MKRVVHLLNELVKKTNYCCVLNDEELQHLKAVFLSMYKDVYAVCKKYDLIVMLNGGSVLGAVRHQGFIPWDDDLDLMLPRKDYNKLIDVFDKELGDKYILSVPGTKMESKTLYMQIIKRGTKMVDIDDHRRQDANGIRIDIHPIDKMPDNKYWRYLKCKILNLIRICALSVTIYQSESPLFRKIFMYDRETKLYYWTRWTIGLICSVFGRNNWYNLFVRFSSSSKGNKYVCIPSCALCEKELQPSRVFFPPRKASFEGLDVFIPNEFDVYLTKQYGDYMKLPPVEKRQRHFYVSVDFGND